MTKNISFQYFIFAAMLLGGGFSFYIFAKRLKHYLLIKDVPTSKVRSAAMGLVELKGKVSPKQLLFSPFSRKACIYYKYRVEEYRKRNSKNGARYSWDQIASGEKRVSFHLDDDTGRTLVMPDKAEFILPIRSKLFQGHSMARNMDRKVFKLLEDNFSSTEVDMNYWGVTTKRSGINMVGDRRFFEYYVEPGESLYILGSASSTIKDDVNIVVNSGENEETFLISNKSEKSLLKAMKFKIFFALLASIALFAASVTGFLKLKNII